MPHRASELDLSDRGSRNHIRYRDLLTRRGYTQLTLIDLAPLSSLHNSLSLFLQALFAPWLLGSILTKLPHHLKPCFTFPPKHDTLIPRDGLSQAWKGRDGGLGNPTAARLAWTITKHVGVCKRHAIHIHLRQGDQN